ncbi:MAG: PAS domain-containing protein [Campylobacterota bacterium]|nr:PAS domain-containing protein [Campylobacterota bacterium]
MLITMKDNDFIVSKTDLLGYITYGNEIFIKMSGYAEKELLNSPHNILRHEDIPAIVFKLLWDRLKSGKSINAYVKNRCKNGDYYWVLANVTPSYDERGGMIGYYSVRRKPSDKALKTIEPIYAELLKIEKQQSVEASHSYLNDVLKKEGVSYDELIVALQK